MGITKRWRIIPKRIIFVKQKFKFDTLGHIQKKKFPYLDTILFLHTEYVAQKEKEKKKKQKTKDP